MKAMILAAGLGTRLKPLTDKIPKALVEIEGVPMLDRIIMKLQNQGFDRIVINVHHFSDMIINYLSGRNYDAEIKISDESTKLLDTGGGIVHAMDKLFSEDNDPVLFHNVDILSNADLKGLMNMNMNSGKGGTLLVSSRPSTRKLIFDEDMTLKGWHDLKMDVFKPQNFKLKGEDIERSFSGIYVLTSEAVEEMKNLRDTDRFSVMDYFLNPQRKINLNGVCDDNLQLLDIGKPASLMQASEILELLNKDPN